MLVIPKQSFQPDQLSNMPSVVAAVGQLERGEQTGYEHWQFVVCFKKKLRLGGVRAIFGPYRAELTNSAAANAYCTKEETRVAGTSFSYGRFPKPRGEKRAWEEIRQAAKIGDFDSIDPDVYIRNYGNLKKIAVDNMKPEEIEREVVVFWGKTGTGKSRRAWEEAGLDAYPKTPTTKYWDGYSGQERVVVDEFRGQVDISHVLRWFDRYPTIVEVKGSSVVFRARKIWITSNLDPREWYPNLDADTKAALMRRLKIIHFPGLGIMTAPPQNQRNPSVYENWARSLIEDQGPTPDFLSVQ